MSFKKIKLELFYIKKSFLKYKKGFRYLYARYFLAKKILKLNKILEKPINNNNLSIHLLTCHRDMVIMIWSVASFYQTSNVIGQLFIHNDGSLTTEDKKIIKKVFPSAKVVETSTFTKDYAAQLDAYPVLKNFRTKYKNFSFKKIIDPYFVSDKKMHLIIDSDLLWFKNPVEIEQEIARGCEKSLMQKNNSEISVTFKDNQALDKRLVGFNAGIILYSKDNFNMEKFVEFLERIDENVKRNLHFVDQVGHAYCLENLEALPEDLYTIQSEVSPDTVARHYTSPKRPLFYIEGINILKEKFL